MVRQTDSQTVRMDGWYNWRGMRRSGIRTGYVEKQCSEKNVNIDYNRCSFGKFVSLYRGSIVTLMGGAAGDMSSFPKFSG